MPASVKQLRDNQNNFIYPKIAKEGLVEPIYGSDVTISTIDGLNSSDVQGALNELVTNLGNIDSVLDNVEIVKTASGSVINVSDSADYRLLGLKLYGKSVQDGTPTPEAPVEIESAGDTGNITLTIANQNFAKSVSYTPATANFGTLVNVNKFSVMPKAGQTYTLSVDLEAENLTKAYWNRYVGFDSDLPFTVNPGKARYSRAITFTKEAQNSIALSKSSTSDGVTITPSNFMITPASVTDVQFVESQSQALTYPTPNGLPGIPVESGGNYTDENGQQWICDEVDFGRGKYVQRVKSVDYDGSTDESWNTSSTNTDDKKRIAINPGNAKPSNITVAANILCTRFLSVPSDNNGTFGCHQGISINTNGIIYIYMEGVTDTAEGWKNWLKSNPVSVIYELATPVETDLTTEQLTAYAALTTYNPNTTITTDSSPAAGMEVRYLTNNGLAEVLEKYATQAWVEGKGYLTAVPDGYATSADVAATYAKKALKFTATFTSSGWTSATGGFSQAVNVAGLTADDEPIIDLNSTATDADTFNGQLEAFGLVSNFTTADGTLTAVVLGDSAPTVDIPIHGVVVY